MAKLNFQQSLFQVSVSVILFLFSENYSNMLIWCFRNHFHYYKSWKSLA